MNYITSAYQSLHAVAQKPVSTLYALAKKIPAPPAEVANELLWNNIYCVTAGAVGAESLRFIVTRIIGCCRDPNA